MGVTEKQLFDESKLFYLTICLMFLVNFMILYVNGGFHFEAIDMGFIKRILHPEYPQGGVIYDPQLHYNYTVAFVGKTLGYEADSHELAAMFYFLEMSLTVIILIKLNNFLFRSDKITLGLLVLMFLMVFSGEVDQKTMATPFCLFSIFYFLKEKWTLSAIFAASLFYLHIGFALWWFLPSCFALGIMFLLKNRRVTLREIVRYPFIVTLLVSPVLYYYMSLTPIVLRNDFATNYFYGINNSVLFALSNPSRRGIMSLIATVVFVVGYNKWRKAGGANACVVPIALGVLSVFVLNFIMVDLMFKRRGNASRASEKYA